MEFIVLVENARVYPSTDQRLIFTYINIRFYQKFLKQPSKKRN